MSELLALLREAKVAQNTRLQADREAKALKEIEDNAMAALQAAMAKDGYFTLSDGVVTASIVTKLKPYIVDYGALESYIVEHKALDLLQKRLTESAVKLRWDDGINIPGVGVSEEQKLTIK